MIKTILRVARAEGNASLIRRAIRRGEEGARLGLLLVRGLREWRERADVLNVCAWPLSGRFGGVPVQLASRLREEAGMRSVAVLYPGILESNSPVWHARRVPRFARTTRMLDEAFEASVAEIVGVTGARLVHIEGTAGIPLDSVSRLAASGLPVVLSIHDFSLFCSRPNLLEEPSGVFCNWSVDADRCRRCLRETGSVSSPGELTERRSAAAKLLGQVRAVVYPSEFMRSRHAELFRSRHESRVIEPGVSGEPIAVVAGARHRIAFVGTVDRHKGGHLLPGIIGEFPGGSVEWHVFGGGDADLLSAVRHLAGVTVHGWYAAGELPSLLRRTGVGLALILSVVPEAYGLTLSEARQAGVPVVAFAHGAIQERVEADGGGWLVAPDAGVAGVVGVLRRWLAGEIPTSVPTTVVSARNAAEAHLSLYESLGASS